MIKEFYMTRPMIVLMYTCLFFNKIGLGGVCRWLARKFLSFRVHVLNKEGDIIRTVDLDFGQLPRNDK